MNIPDHLHGTIARIVIALSARHGQSTNPPNYRAAKAAIDELEAETLAPPVLPHNVSMAETLDEEICRVFAVAGVLTIGDLLSVDLGQFVGKGRMGIGRWNSIHRELMRLKLSHTSQGMKIERLAKGEQT